jgi:prepilin-type N-terminal cleavage/methylation domain-containing protein/prepilin-type processing-associated H-X9-DG protein
MKQAFTLVELLVVIGIIAVLVSVLLPTLGRAKESANSITCASNLRQLALATTIYTHENRGYFPPGYDFRDKTYWPVRLQKYVKSTEVYICPSRIMPLVTNTYQANGNTWMFWDNQTTGMKFTGPGAGGRKVGPTKIATIRRSTQVVMFTEQTREVHLSHYWKDNILKADFQGQFMYDPTLIDPGSGASYGSLSGGRHFRKPYKNYFWGKSNFVFVDGSVRSNVSMQKIVELSKSGRWLGYPIDDANRITDIGFPGTIPARPTNSVPLEFWLVPWW